jgi:tetratricopeptide (TPR) repeat protein
MADKKQQAQEAKAKGNKAFEQGKHEEAVKWYSQAISADPSDHVLYSNRAAAYLGLNQFDKAFDDSHRSIQLKDDWAKGYYRKGCALIGLKRWEEAIQVLQKGLQLDSKNADMKKKLEDATREHKKNPTKPKAVEGPVADGADSGPLDAKAEGNKHFKESRYEKAIECYTRALQVVTDPKERSIIHSNRAACYNQLRLYDEVVNDCNQSISLEPNNVKSLLRRGYALEALDKHKRALEDFKRVLELDPTAQTASDAIARISKALAQFEKYSNGKK